MTESPYISEWNLHKRIYNPCGKILHRLSDLTASYHAFGIGTLSIKNADIPEDILPLTCIEPDDLTETKNLELIVKEKMMDEWLEKKTFTRTEMTRYHPTIHTSIGNIYVKGVGSF